MNQALTTLCKQVSGLVIIPPVRFAKKLEEKLFYRTYASI